MADIKAVIFDWAGTTVDYGCFAPVRAMDEVFREFGIVPTMEEIREPMGMLKIDHIRAMLKMPRISGLWQEKYGTEPTEKDVKQMFFIFEDKLMQVLHLYTDVKPGVVKAVSMLREQGIKIGSTTGYTDQMMEIVAASAKQKGYFPDICVSPDGVGQKGRPYPYMIFRNMEMLQIEKVQTVLKIGDTVSDIKEGKNAGVITAGVIIGSSEMGLSEMEFNALGEEERRQCMAKVRERFLQNGADVVFDRLDETFYEFVLHASSGRE